MKYPHVLKHLAISSHPSSILGRAKESYEVSQKIGLKSYQTSVNPLRLGVLEIVDVHRVFSM